jgi:hypothetical protein
MAGTVASLADRIERLWDPDKPNSARARDIATSCSLCGSVQILVRPVEAIELVTPHSRHQINLHVFADVSLR